MELAKHCSSARKQEQVESVAAGSGVAVLGRYSVAAWPVALLKKEQARKERYCPFDRSQDQAVTFSAWITG